MLMPSHAGDVKKGSYVMIKCHPCKAQEIKTSKTGKHGHAKCNITGICVLTGKKYVDVQPSHANMYAPVVTKTEYQLMFVDENDISMLDADNAEYTVAFDPNNEQCVSLLEAYEADPEQEIVVSMLIAPLIVDEKSNKVEKQEKVDGWKNGKVSQ